MKQATSQQETKPMSEAAAYREYIDPNTPPDPPRATVGDIELMSQTIAVRVWAMRTKHSLAEVLSAGYFDGTRNVGLKKEDRIEIVASWHLAIAEHATLVVAGVGVTGIPAVSLLHRYERNA
jgi:hypothetical protein